MIRYKGYIGKIEYDDKAKIFHGEVIGLKDVITFQGTTAKEIEVAFKESINDYLNWCKDRNEKPEKTFSGKFSIKLSPELHAKIFSVAQAKGLSIGAYIEEELDKIVKL